MAPSRAATALARLTDVFINREFQDGMRKAGLAIEDVNHKLLPFPQIIEKIAALNPKRLNTIIQTITAFGAGRGKGREFTVQARRALTPLIAGLEEYRRVQGNVVNDNDEFTKSFAAMSQTMGVRWQIFLNQLKVLILYIGEDALPVFVEIGETIGGWVDKWKSLDEGLRANIVRWGVAIGVGTLLLGIFSALAGSVVTLIAALIRVGPSLAKIGPSMTKLLTTAKGLAGLGLITIGVELFRQGGNWQYIGPILAAAGLGAMRGGVGGAATGIAIAVGVELIFKGNNWQSKVGRILMGIGAGAAVGGAPGAIIGGSLATIQVALEDSNAQTKLLNLYDNIQKRYNEVVRTTAVSQNISIDAATRQVDMAMNAWVKKKGLTKEQARQYAIEWLSTFERQFKLVTGKRDTTLGVEKLRNMNLPDIDKKLTLREALKSAKSYTQILELVKQQTSAVTDETTKLAARIAMAFSRGNIGNAAALLNQFVQQSQRKLTGANVLKLITDAVQSGDVQGAVNLMNQWNDTLRQSQDEWKQYAEAVKEYNQQATQAATDAQQEIIGSMKSMYMQLEQVNRTAFGELFKGPWLTSETFDLAKEWGITPQINDMIRDLDMQINQFRDRRKMLATLLKRGIPVTFLDELQQMTPEEAMPILKELVDATPKETARLIARLKQRESLIKKATQIDFSREIEQFRKAGVNMADAIRNGFQDAKVEEWFSNWVQVKFPQVIQDAVNKAVSDWRKANPAPVKPPAIPTASTTNNRTTDNSKHANVHVTLGSYNDRTKQDIDDAVRRAAFAATASVRGWF